MKAKQEYGVKKVHYLGYFDDDMEAAIVRDKFIINNNLQEWNILNYNWCGN